jgi:hypothetical protein
MQSFHEHTPLAHTANILTLNQVLTDDNTDASDVRMGAVLSQIQDGVERVISYFR